MDLYSNLGNKVFINGDATTVKNPLETFEGCVNTKYSFGQIKLMVCGMYLSVIVNMEDDIYYMDLKGAPIKMEGCFGKIKELSCGEYHVAFINESGQLFTFGENYYGQLGISQDIEKKWIPTLISGEWKKIKHVACGTYHTAILTTDDEVYVTGLAGYNNMGEIYKFMRCGDKHENVES